jgi:hypothetical protein
MKILGQTLLVAAIVLTLIVASRALNRIEQFGMSPGTLTQLQSTHVPDKYDAETLDAMGQEMKWSSKELTGSL